MSRSAITSTRAERDHREGRDEADHDQVRRQREEPAVGGARDDVLLEEVLEPVGEPLEEALRPDAVRPDPRLDARPDAPLEPARDAGDRQHEPEDDDRAEEQHRDRATSS